jgi:hypothetical protein
MTWDITTARVVAGVPVGDTTKDAAIQSTMDYVLAVVEKLLGRGLLFKREEITFYEVDTRKIRVPRYPISRVFSMNGHPVTGIVQYRVGWIEVNHSFNRRVTVTVDYEGGYKILPSDLERTLWEIFQTVWENTNQQTGAPVPGSGATVVAGSGDVSSVSFGNFGSVRFDVGATTVGGESSSSSTADQQARWGWLAPWAWVLETYRSESAPSVVFA